VGNFDTTHFTMAALLSLLLRLCQGTASRMRNLAYRLLGAEIRHYCWLRAIEIPRNWKDIVLHPCSLDRGVVLLCSGPARRGKIEIGEGTYINRYTILDAHERIAIGREVMIGPHCFITDGNHGMDPADSVKSQPMTAAPVEIEDEVWIGAHVTILPGVRIGRGAVIGAGSVVTRDIAAGSIANGTPARFRRMRGEPRAPV
jgi:acetyltransferase-like isoleucine patch superfamily enzyme